ncbi:sigma factor [Saccharothrix sp. 6-C]|uniref:sigma factor n=1 Tax=Saccharothrix sp. 6-C TaxID=2781735 RepID=UPI002E2A5B72|nr:sigma factor [Saccharothrix sp. 6-C]
MASHRRGPRRTGGGRDRTTFGELYDRYAKPAYSLARRIRVDPDLAEDVVHEPFPALWRNPAAYDHSRGGFVPA